MTQTVLSQVADLFKGLFPLPEQPDEAVATGDSATRDDDPLEADARFGREEAYYWAMHAHW